MPWTVADVDKHKKGLSDKGKAQWVAVANSVLAKCIKNGGTDATCAPSAIRQANGVTGNSVFTIYKNRQKPTHTPETIQHEGVTHLKVPVVMMVEGVHNGSHGPLLYTAEELSKFPEAWDGRPVVIDHPEVEGVYISANSPQMIEQRKIGNVYNTHMDGSRLMAELWINEEKIRQMSSAVLAALQAGQTLEVSLGMFTEEEQVSGTWRGETYDAIARNNRPDHLALLPGGVGACSIADGCGTCVNSALCINKKGGTDVNELEFDKALKDFYVSQLHANAEQGYKEIVDAARSKLDSMDSNDSINFLQEVYDDFLVYETRLRLGGAKVYKQEYEYKDGAVVLKGNPTEVRKKVEYVALAEGSGIERTKFNNNSNKEEHEMADEKCAPCIKKKVDALIAHTSKKFAETDRPWLETFSEDQLEKMIPTVIEKEVTKEVNALTDVQKAALAYGEKVLKERREKLIKGIQTNAKDVWTDADLADMDEVKLEKVFISVNKVKVDEFDYSVTGESDLNVNECKEAPMLLTGAKLKTK